LFYANPNHITNPNLNPNPNPNPTADPNPILTLNYYNAFPMPASKLHSSPGPTVPGHRRTIITASQYTWPHGSIG